MNANNQFGAKPWGDTDRSIILKIMNSSLKYRSPENHIEHKQDVLDKIFGEDTDFSRDVLCFENEKNEIVGFAGLTNNSGNTKTWRIAYHVLPEYLDSSLPKILIEECLTLAKRSDLPEVLLRTSGYKKEFDRELKAHGCNPFHYIWGMNMTDFNSDIIPIVKTPIGVSIQQFEELEDYTQLNFVRNEAFRNSFNFIGFTLEEWMNFIELQKNYFTLRFFVASDGEILVGYGFVVIHEETKIAYGRTLAVLPKYRNRGIGGTLIREVIGFLHNEGIKQYRFHVDGENERAMDLYKRNGFQELKKTHRRYYRLK